MSTSLEVFCCYAREDQEMLVQLTKHLAPLERRGQITIWSDTNLNAGVEWEKELHQHLNSADIILLLISPDFMASDYCYSTEMGRAIQRHDEGSAVVIPILLRPSLWQDAPFAKLQIVPTGTKPITDWPNRDGAFHDVAKHINRVVSTFSSQHITAEASTRPTVNSEHTNVLVGQNDSLEKFSQRIGIPQVNTAPQRDSMDMPLKKALWNAAYDRLRWGDASYYAQKFAEQVWQYCFNNLLEEVPGSSFDDLLKAMKEHYFTLKWYEVYNFLEYVAAHTERPEILTKFVGACNTVLQRELSAYRFAGKKLVLMTEDQELLNEDESQQ